MENYDDESSPLERRKLGNGTMLAGAILSLLFGGALLIYFIVQVSKPHSLPGPDGIESLSNYGLFGDFVGGLIGTMFSLAGFFLLYLTLYEQRQNFYKERLENNFFEMVKFHKENVAELQFTYNEDDTNTKVTAVKRKVFKIIYSQFKSLWDELDFIFQRHTIEQIYKSDFLDNNLQPQNTNFDLKNKAQIDITYLIVFFGLSREDQSVLKTLFSRKYNADFINEILNFAMLKPKRESNYWSQWQKITNADNDILKYNVFKDFYRIRNNTYVFNKVTMLYFNPFIGNSYYADDYFKYYGGHQFRLGHYFRNLYQNVNYINNQAYLNYSEKYEYVKILRGQLSNYEQMILFFNSVSIIGENWEYGKNDINQQLITKYNFLKNIPNQNLLMTIDIKKYYPNLSYEMFQGNVKARKELVKIYK